MFVCVYLHMNVCRCTTLMPNYNVVCIIVTAYFPLYVLCVHTIFAKALSGPIKVRTHIYGYTRAYAGSLFVYIYMHT